MNVWDYLNARAERIENRSTDRVIAITQRNNTYFYGTMFFLSLVPLFFLPDPTDVVKTIMIATSSTLGTIAVMQNQFWYGRHRGGGIPDPATTTTVSVTTPTDPLAPVAPIAPSIQTPPAGTIQPLTQPGTRTEEPV
jgi:hypothetical protein